ncbi:hypothetical protein MesoLjLc_50350 [Mesorhizobium sp. L-8-10]|uniref:hypothetical protein n=1 Tax=Mesorhizobium sp. L-8-10 TaxID=2744523 RepID=UPI001927F4D2|nr:hypothetical protein [Mesorhizobium sp. L-8-10]BCH33105.1 hypothetical protein MesoLjLc_50350 [Mesorhizobium sp. L-8-10]
MAKDLKVGDRITLHWTVRRVLDDGDVAMTHPLYSVPITINSNEIDEADVQRGKGQPKEPAPKMRYEVGVLEKAPDGKTLRRPLATADTKEDANALKELHEATWIDEIPVAKPKKKR